jgi:hypothetical protein
MGGHPRSDDPRHDSYTLGQVSQAVSPVLRIAKGSESILSFWHIVSLADSRMLNASGALDRAVVQVSVVDPKTGEPASSWQTIPAFKNWTVQRSRYPADCSAA